MHTALEILEISLGEQSRKEWEKHGRAVFLPPPRQRQTHRPGTEVRQIVRLVDRAIASIVPPLNVACERVPVMNLTVWPEYDFQMQSPLYNSPFEMLSRCRQSDEDHLFQEHTAMGAPEASTFALGMPQPAIHSVEPLREE
jgi:hypothetical protein